MLTHHIILYYSYQFNFHVPKSSRLSRQLQDRASTLLIIAFLTFYTKGEALPNGCSFTRSNDDGLCLSSGSDCCTSKSNSEHLYIKMWDIFRLYPPPKLKGCILFVPPVARAKFLHKQLQCNDTYSITGGGGGVQTQNIKKCFEDKSKTLF